MRFLELRRQGTTPQPSDFDADFPALIAPTLRDLTPEERHVLGVTNGNSGHYRRYTGDVSHSGIWLLALFLRLSPVVKCFEAVLKAAPLRATSQQGEPCSDS